MNDRRAPALLTACAVMLIAGCATAPGVVELDARNTKVEPLFRVEQPAGTAAGQYAVGRIDLMEGRLDAAILRFRNALQLQPGYVEAINGLGIAFGRKERYAEAVEAFRSAVAASPGSAHLLNNLGYAQLKTGRLQEAAVSLEQALRLDPHDVRTRENVRQLSEAKATAGRGVQGDTAQSETSQPTHPQTQVAEAASSAPDLPVYSTQIAMVAGSSLAQAQPKLSIVPVRAPRAQRALSGGYEIVVPRSGDSALVQVAPAVYELRSSTAPQETPSSSAKAQVVAQVEPAPTLIPTLPVPLARLEVSNGAGTSRLATRTARRLEQMGATISRITNYPGFGWQQTEIHYREGHAERAKLLGERLPVGAKLVGVEGLRSDVDIRLVVGRNMAAQDVAAWWSASIEVARRDETRDEAVVIAPASPIDFVAAIASP